MRVPFNYLPFQFKNTGEYFLLGKNLLKVQNLLLVRMLKNLKKKFQNLLNQNTVSLPTMEPMH